MRLLPLFSPVSVDDVHDGAAFRMAQRKFTQVTVMFSDGGAASSAGMVAPVQQTNGDTSGFAAHLPTVSIQFVEYGPVVLAVRCDEGATVAGCVVIPVPAVVGFAKSIHPGEGARFRQHPLRDFAEVLWPEVKALSVRY